MKTLDYNAFKRLSDVHEARCISILMPVHQKGVEVLNKEDQLLYKNLLKEAQLQAQAKGYAGSLFDKVLSKAADLLTDNEFWRHQEAGLAVFVADDMMEAYPLSGTLNPVVGVGHQFLVKPLIPFLRQDPAFFLLVLGLEGVRLFQMDNSQIEEVRLAVPKGILEVSGSDVVEDKVGMHSGGGRKGGMVYHGYGEGKDDRKMERDAYFHETAGVINEWLANRELPLVLAGLPDQVAMYRKHNTYRNVFPEALTGNPAVAELDGLRKSAVELLRPLVVDEVKEEKKALVQKFYLTERGSCQLAEILPAAMGGRVDTLFIDEDFEQWGIYDQAHAKVVFSEEENLASVSLTNMAAVAVLENGGQVYLEKRKDLPVEESGINALYRY